MIPIYVSTSCPAGAGWSESFVIPVRGRITGIFLSLGDAGGIGSRNAAARVALFGDITDILTGPSQVAYTTQAVLAFIQHNGQGAAAANYSNPAINFFQPLNFAVVASQVLYFQGFTNSTAVSSQCIVYLEQK